MYTKIHANVLVPKRFYVFNSVQSNSKTTGAHTKVYGRAQKSFWVTLYTVENINFIKLLGTKT
jgi:hypothetical protein